MKVINRQLNSKNCIVCGMENPLGLKAGFYNLEGDVIGALFTFKSEHQSYPSRTHGGMISALLDELMGRALWIKQPTTYGVTTTMNITFRKPVPYGVPLKAAAYITHDALGWFSAQGFLYDNDDNLLAEGSARYLKLSPKKAFGEGADDHDEMCYDIKDGVTKIDFANFKKQP